MLFKLTKPVSVVCVKFRYGVPHGFGLRFCLCNIQHNDDARPDLGYVVHRFAQSRGVKSMRAYPACGGPVAQVR